MSAERPYPGTRPFLSGERGRFFGRATEAADLAGLWRTNRLTILHGHSGGGKTSLLHAGVLPLVRGGSAEVLAPGRVSFGVTFPDAALPAHNPYTLAVLRSWLPGEAATRLVGLTVQEFVSRRAERHAATILAAIDQAEELLVDSGPRRTHSRRFLGELADALRECPNLHLLITVREEALDLVVETLGNGAQQCVKQLSFDRALEAVTGPIDGTDRCFTVGAAEKLVTDLLPHSDATAEDGGRSAGFNQVEPALLQVVCARLWESLPTDVETITEREVLRYGDTDAALAIHCGRIIATVAENNDMRAARLRSWLVRTFITEHGTRGTAYEGMTDTAGAPNAVARALEDRHLLSAERRSGSRWYQLLSDRLIEPLRASADERPPQAEFAELLQSAERTLALGEMDLAERYVRKALRTLPETDLRQRGEAESLLGNLAYERGKPGDAETHYRTAAKLLEAVRDTEAVASQLAAVGQTLLAQGQPADAVQQLAAAVDRIPHDLVVQTELGWALWELGQARAAVDVLTGVLAIDGGNPYALRARGEILADLGNARDALRDLDRVEQHDQPSTRAARVLARAELGDQSTEEEIESALADAPRNGPVLLYAARTEALGGNKVAAAELARRALNATDPAPPPHQREAALTLLGQNGSGRR